MIYVNDKPIKWFKGITITDVIRLIGEDYPYVAVHVDDKIVTLPKFDKYLVKDRSEIYLMPLITGG